jgi:glucosamine-6-phosphate deaminase
MRVAVFRSSREAASAVAELVAGAVRRERRLVIGLPTGRTMIPMYRVLRQVERRRRLDFSRLTTFNLDEFDGIPAEHPGSYRNFMRRHLFDGTNVRADAVHFPEGRPSAPEDYDVRIENAGGMDLCIVGLGSNGHLGFNEPGTHLTAHTHRVSLLPATRRANAYLFRGDVRRVPTHAISMGIGTILRARLVVLLATGREKAAILRRALTGPVTTRVPGSFLQVHPQVVVVLDRAAAAGLRGSGRPRSRRSA